MEIEVELEAGRNRVRGFPMPPRVWLDGAGGSGRASSSPRRTTWRLMRLDQCVYVWAEMDEDGVLIGTRRIWSFASDPGSERDERGWGVEGAVIAEMTRMSLFWRKRQGTAGPLRR